MTSLMFLTRFAALGKEYSTSFADSQTAKAVKLVDPMHEGYSNQSLRSIIHITLTLTIHHGFHQDWCMVQYV